MFALRVGAAAFGGLALGFLGGMVGFGQGPSLLLLVYWVAEDPINALLMQSAGFNQVPSYYPYWDVVGKTYEDLDGYRIVLQNREWSR